MNRRILDRDVLRYKKNIHLLSEIEELALEKELIATEITEVVKELLKQDNDEDTARNVLLTRKKRLKSRSEILNRNLSREKRRVISEIQHQINYHEF